MAKGKKEDIKEKKKGKELEELVTPEQQFQMAALAASTNFADAFQSFIYDSDKMRHNYYDTGSISLNTALGGRGIVEGRIVEVWGPPKAGKTSLALEIAWNIQNLTNKGVVFVDIEHKLDRTLFSSWKGGFKPNLTYYIEPWTGEQAFDVILSFVQSPGVGAIILDSVSGLLPSAFMDGESNQMAQQASLIRNKLPTISALASKAGVTILTVNQARAKLEINKYVKGRYKLRKTGGYALEHWTAVSMYMDKDGAKTSDAMKKGFLTDGQRDLGHWAKIYIDKNNTGDTLLKEINLCLIYGYGFDMVADLIDRAVSVGLIVQSGSWYAIDDINVQGEANLRAELKARPKLLNKLKTDMESMQMASVDAHELGIIDNAQEIGGADGLELDASELTEDMKKSLEEN